MADITSTAPATAPLGRPEGRYHSDQIAAHWTIVFLLVFQFATGGAMEAAMDLGYASDALPPAGAVWVHAPIGLSILAVMVWRFALRRKYGAPPPPETEPHWLQRISRGTHFAFYALLIAMPLAGLAALVTLNETIGALHGLTALLLLALMALHVAGALYHAFKRDGIVVRVLSGQPPRVTVPPSERPR